MGGGSPLQQDVQNFFTDFKTTMQFIAPIAVLIGCIGIGMMYVLSPVPVIAQWKQQNPTAFTALFIGIIILIAAGGIASLVSFT